MLVIRLTRYFLPLSIVLFAIALTACGNGGGSGASTTTVASTTQSDNTATNNKTTTERATAIAAAAALQDAENQAQEAALQKFGTGIFGQSKFQ